MKPQAFLLLLCLWVGSVQAHDNESAHRYRRSSLYSVLLKHPEKEFCREITEVFYSIPIPEKFDNHDLKIKVINATPGRKDRPKELMQQDNVHKFISSNAIGRRLVAEWFDRDSKSGAFSMDLVAQRGYYDATMFDIALANQLFRGHALLADAGQELIGNTFVLVNDIRYVDKEEAAAMASFVFALVGTVAGGFESNAAQLVSGVSKIGEGISDEIVGFSVNITSYLYRLDWTDDIANAFYSDYYMDSQAIDPAKKTAFDREKNLFTMTFMGAQTVHSGKTSLRGVSTREDMIKKVCTRAIDEAIVQLQRKHDEFKVKTPLLSAAPLTASIGRKEGVAEDSKLEVLEYVQDAKGRTQYKRVGVIAPVKGKIWDNRYLSVAERSVGSELTVTEFKKISGGNFEAGMLIREIK
ncbi:MAG: hypothetical protein LBJ57_02045 [Prevotellaceae bacterium]|nr:hypothetical protein [Prevotellaceae bacterium]